MQNLPKSVQVMLNWYANGRSNVQSLNRFNCVQIRLPITTSSCSSNRAPMRESQRKHETNKHTNHNNDASHTQKKYNITIEIIEQLTEPEILL